MVLSEWPQGVYRVSAMEELRDPWLTRTADCNKTCKTTIGRELIALAAGASPPARKSACHKNSRPNCFGRQLARRVSCRVAAVG